MSLIETLRKHEAFVCRRSLTETEKRMEEKEGDGDKMKWKEK